MSRVRINRCYERGSRWGRGTKNVKGGKTLKMGLVKGELGMGFRGRRSRSVGGMNLALHLHHTSFHFYESVLQSAITTWDPHSEDLKGASQGNIRRTPRLGGIVATVIRPLASSTLAADWLSAIAFLDRAKLIASEAIHRRRPATDRFSSPARETSL